MLKKLPNQIPIFPLSGVIYFPKTNLPLNIFEQRYLDLVNDAIHKDKLMGMIQSIRKSKEVYTVGCLGEISDIQKSKDGRIFINLTGLTRFEVVGETENSKLYREFKVNYKKFNLDLKPIKEEVNIKSIIEKARIFFEKTGLLLNWNEFEKLDNSQKINTLAMIAPITNEEKQKLLESVSLQDKIVTLGNIVNFYLHEVDFSNQTIQ
jgi:Lon protease-like protein|tara:strand:+ start:226 stop:846 length:621 start_codon:yes stop_codon:yes gene_type:complete